MSLPQKIEQIRQLVSKDLLEEAANLLLETDLKTQGYAIKARLADYRQKLLQGILSEESQGLIKRQITASLLQATDVLENPDLRNPDTPVDTIRFQYRSRKTWLYALIGLLTISLLGVFANMLYQQAQTGGSLTVMVHGKQGLDEIILPNRGIVELIHGKAKRTEQVNNKGVAHFDEIPASFFDPDASVKILFQDPEGEPYRATFRDSLYILVEGQSIELQVNIDRIDVINGHITKRSTSTPIPDAKIVVKGVEVFSDQNGNFSLPLPERKQSKMQTIRVYKDGYEPYVDNDVPIDSDIELAIQLSPE